MDARHAAAEMSDSWGEHENEAALPSASDTRLPELSSPAHPGHPGHPDAHARRARGAGRDFPSEGMARVARQLHAGACEAASAWYLPGGAIGAARTRATAPLFASSDAERACRSCAGLLGIPCPDTQKSRVLNPLRGHPLKPALLGTSAVTAKLVPAWEGNMNKTKVWMRCQVSPGMFSDERTVEVEGRYFFVEEVSVRNVGADGWGELEVTIIERDGHRWAVLPTNYSDSVLLEA